MRRRAAPMATNPLTGLWARGSTDGESVDVLLASWDPPGGSDRAAMVHVGNGVYRDRGPTLGGHRWSRSRIGRGSPSRGRTRDTEDGGSALVMLTDFLGPIVSTLAPRILGRVGDGIATALRLPWVPDAGSAAGRIEVRSADAIVAVGVATSLLLKGEGVAK